MSGGGCKNRTYPRHLPVVGRGMNADVSSMGEGGKAGKAKEGQTDKADFACCIRADVYRNHISYNY